MFLRLIRQIRQINKTSDLNLKVKNNKKKNSGCKTRNMELIHNQSRMKCNYFLSEKFNVLVVQYAFRNLFKMILLISYHAVICIIRNVLEIGS